MPLCFGSIELLNIWDFKLTNKGQAMFPPPPRWDHIFQLFISISKGFSGQQWNYDINKDLELKFCITFFSKFRNVTFSRGLMLGSWEHDYSSNSVSAIPKIVNIEL